MWFICCCGLSFVAFCYRTNFGEVFCNCLVGLLAFNYYTNLGARGHPSGRGEEGLLSPIIGRPYPPPSPTGFLFRSSSPLPSPLLVRLARVDYMPTAATLLSVNHMLSQVVAHYRNPFTKGGARYDTKRLSDLFSTFRGRFFDCITLSHCRSVR